MASQNIVWAEGDVPEAVESWVAGFFAAADTKGDAAAKRFSEFFHDDGVMVGMGPALHGKQVILQSRMGVWDTVQSRKHVVSKVYTLKKDFSEIMILGNLESTMKNGKSFEMEFAAQTIFQGVTSEKPKAIHYCVWADKRIAMEAAKG